MFLFKILENKTKKLSQVSVVNMEEELMKCALPNKIVALILHFCCSCLGQKVRKLLTQST